MATREVTRTSRGERRRERIIDAARAAFAARGYDGTSISEIADQADVAKSVIYDHFPSKAELLKEVVLAADAERKAKVAAAIEAQAAGSPSDRLRAGVDANLRFVAERPDAWAVLAADPPADPELRAFLHERRARESESVANRFIPDRVVDPEIRRRKQILAEFYRTGLDGLARWWRLHPETPRERLVEAIAGLDWFSFADDPSQPSRRTPARTAPPGGPGRSA